MSDECCCGDKKAETGDQNASSVMEILNVRFAKGEIDKAEFEEKRQILSGSPAQASAATGKKSCC